MTLLRRALACAQIVLLVSATSCLPQPLATPRHGFTRAEEPLRYPLEGLPGTSVHLAGGALHLERLEISLETHLGTWELVGHYSSAQGRWRHSVDAYWSRAWGAATLPNGRIVAVGGLEPGERIPGTDWWKLDADRLRRRDGTVLEFHPDGPVAALYRHGAPYPRLRFSSATFGGVRRATGVSDCVDPSTCYPVASWGRSADGLRLVSVDDRAGRHVAISPTLQRDQLAVDLGLPGNAYAYDAAGRLLEWTTPDGVRATFGYLAGHLVEAVAGETRAWAFHHEALGAGGGETVYTTTVTTPTGHTDRYAFDGEARLLERSGPEGLEVSLGWEGLEIVARTQNGLTTTWQRGHGWEVETPPTGNAIGRIFHDGAHTTDGSRPILAAWDQAGPLEARTYTAEGRLAVLQNGAGEAVSLTYDALGRLATVTTAEGATFAILSYGADGLPRAVESGGQTAFQTFDAVGNELTGFGVDGPTDAGRPGVVRREFDAARRMVGLYTVDEAGYEAETRIELRHDGRPVAIRRPYGGATEWDRDALGDATARRERVDGAWQTTVIERDALGRVTRREHPNGMVQTAAFDGLGRAWALGAIAPSGHEQMAAMSYEAGRLARIYDAAHGWSPETRTYAPDGQLARVDYPAGESLEFYRDARGRPTLEVYRDASGIPVHFLERVFDGANREVSLRDQNGTLIDRTIEAGAVTEARYGNGLTRTFTWAAGRLTATSMTDAAGQPVHLFEMRGCLHESWAWEGYAGCGVAESWTAGEGWRSEGYALAPLDGYGARLLAERSGGLDDPGPAPGDPQFKHDALGNLVWGLSLPPISFNAEHSRLESVGATVYETDAAGYVTRRDGVALDWDGNGRIRAVGASQYAHDALGRLVSSPQGVAFWAGRGLGPDASGPTSLLAGDVTLAIGGGGARYAHRDWRGNVALETDDAGAVVGETVFGAYGPIEVSGTPERGFAGGRPMAEGLIALGARVYDPLAGRFLGPDPVFHILDQYAYAEGNPVTFWDAGGTQASPTATAIKVGGTSAVGLGMMGTGLALATTQGATFSLVFIGGMVSGAGLIVLGAALTYGFVQLLAPAGPGGYRVGTVTIEDLDANGDVAATSVFPAYTPPPEGSPKIYAVSSPIGGFSGGGSAGCAPTALFERSPMRSPVALSLAFVTWLAAMATLIRRKRAAGGPR